jgi:hypothetical protein
MTNAIEKCQEVARIQATCKAGSAMSHVAALRTYTVVETARIELDGVKDEVASSVFVAIAPPHSPSPFRAMLVVNHVYHHGIPLNAAK